MSDTFIPVSKAERCVVCGGGHKCSRTPDGLLLCGRSRGEQPGFRYLGVAANPIWHMYRVDDGDTRPRSEGGKPPKPASLPPTPRSSAAAASLRGRVPIDFAALAEEYERKLTTARLRILAVSLGLPPTIFGRLPGVGFDPETGAYIFPERDGEGHVCGLLRRLPDGAKRAVPGSRRGLTIPGGWADEAGAIFVVEGPSDTLALTACGLTALGRPSNAGGADDLIALLGRLIRPRPIVVVGENDRKPDGLWPGKDGAMAVARSLAAALPHPVAAVLPPPEYKDVREWVVDRSRDAAENFDWGALGADIAHDLSSRAFPVTADAARKPARRFPLPVRIGDLQKPGAGGVAWVWDGFLARDAVTLLSALPKCGKTTLIGHLLASLQAGGLFCGRTLVPGKAIIVSEEPAGVWAERRDELGIPNAAVSLFTRGVFARAGGTEDWEAFITYLSELLDDDPTDLVVFDTIANLWPVKDENSSAEVTAAMAPLHRLCKGRSVLLVHHLRKSDGSEGTGSRGSGAIAGFVDVILELRRQKPSLDPGRRRRVLTGYGRYDAIPQEWVIELTTGDDGRNRFEAVTGGHEAAPGPRSRADLTRAAIRELLEGCRERNEGGMTRKQLWEAIPEELRVNEAAFRAILDEGSGKDWTKEERGGRSGGSVYRAGDRR